jgi:Ricin-type beta-trefoil lectin domain
VSRALSRTMATCVAAVALAAALGGGPAYAAGSAAPRPHPAYIARPAGGLFITKIPNSGNFQIHNGRFLGKCLGIAGAPPNGPAGDWNCNTNPTTNADQTWHWGSPIASGWNQLVNGRGQCLGVAGGSDNRNARIVGWTCLPGHPDQYWADPPFLRPDGNGTVTNYNGWFDPNAQAWIVGVGGANPANGAPLVLYPDTGTPDQEWF